MLTINKNDTFDEINIVRHNQSRIIESEHRQFYSDKKNSLASELALMFRKKGFNFFTSVPCGVLNPLLTELEENSSEEQFSYLPREDMCLAVACGAYLSGLKPVVLMQNSGFGQSINVLASLIIPFKIPLTLVISNRGDSNDDSEENKVMGQATKSIIDLLKIPYKEVSIKNYQESLDWAKNHSEEKYPIAILLESNLFGWSVKK